MAISFSSISTNIRTSGIYVEFDNSRAVQGSPPMPSLGLLITQRLAAGSVAAEVPTLVPSATKGETYFGHGSLAADMIDKFKDANPYTELWVLALDDKAAGTAAIGTLTFSGTATEDGVIYLYIGGERITVAVTNGDAHTVVSAAVDAAITAHLLTSNLSISSAEAGGVVTLTFLHKGTLGNGLDVRLNYNQGELLPAGITVVVGATAGAVSSTNSAPYDLEPGQTLLIAVDGAGAATATFDAAAGSVTDTTVYPVADQDTLTEKVTIGGGTEQTVTFAGATTTALQIAAQLNAGLVDCSANVVGGQVVITPDTRGTGSTVAIGVGTCALTWGAPVAGTGDVADIDAVTHAEAKALIEADVAGCTYTPATGAGVATVTSDTKGASSSIEFTGGTARTIFGFPLGLNSGTGVSSSVMSGGAIDPDVADAITAIGDAWYNHIVSAYADDTNQDKLETELLARWGPMIMREGHSYLGVVGNLSTCSAAGNARNSPFCTLKGCGLSPTPPWIWAIDVAAVSVGEPDPARPRQTLLLPHCLPPAKEDIFTLAERQILLTDGVSTYTVSQTGECYIERLITTYQTNPGGVPDPSYLNATTMYILAYLRYSWRVRIALKYPRHKLADDGTNFGPGQAIVTPSILGTEAVAWFMDMETMGLVEGFEQFKKDLIVERNAGDPDRVDMRLSPDLINGFRVLAAQMQFLV